MRNPTNVLAISMAVLPEDKSGTQQVVFYDPGVGSDGTEDTSQTLSGLFGLGVHLNIQQLYSFLALNYDEGDEVYLFGYSRGAFTVRSLAGMIRRVGLVHRNRLHYVASAFQLYQKNLSRESAELTQFRAENGQEIPIKMMCCFDTVGSMGLPFNFPIYPLSLISKDKYAFHDISLNADVEHAVHIMSIDEDQACK